MLCEGHSQIQVWFRYASSDPWTVWTSTAAVGEVKCETVKETTPDKYYYATFFYNTSDGTPTMAACSQLKVGYTEPVFKAPFDSWGFRRIYRSWYVVTYQNGQEVYSYQPYGVNDLTLTYVEGACPNSTVADWANQVYPDSIIWHRVDGGEDPSSTVFKIISVNGVTLFEQPGTTCPEYLIKCGDACPPETCCECDDGERVCCYGSDGTAIYSYSK